MPNSYWYGFYKNGLWERFLLKRLVCCRYPVNICQLDQRKMPYGAVRVKADFRIQRTQHA